MGKKPFPSPQDFAMQKLDQQIREQGFRRVLGMDEVGRGALAGPVTVGGVVFPSGVIVPGVRDSKSLYHNRRAKLNHEIGWVAQVVATASRDQGYIDRFGIVMAVKACQLELIERLRPDYLLLDAFALPEVQLPQTALVRGDTMSLSIAAASIVAKVARDAYMTEVDALHRQYGFAANKGYGTAMHRAALVQFGPCDLHRVSFLTSFGVLHA